MTAPNHDDRMLDSLQRDAFGYFLHEDNPSNGLIADTTRPGWPASIAAVGLALSAYPVGVERDFCMRATALTKTLATLRFFRDSTQSSAPDATGYKGFYYHFLDMETGRRAWKCELSTIDSALLFAGMLSAAAYFTDDDNDEREVRTLAKELYARADWPWAQNKGVTVTHGWKPESGFLRYRWEGYDEALLLYMLGLGSPSYPLSSESYKAWATTYKWKKIYGTEFLYAGPLFIHQLSHVWIDFRGIQDAFMRARGIDYFENSRRATLLQQQYATRNPRRFKGYGTNCWGITASDGPGPKKIRIKGIERQFYDYVGRGVPFGPDDGTIAPWAVVASLPFGPEIVLPAIHYFNQIQLRENNRYGFKSTFNPTYPAKTGSEHGWVSQWHCGLNQGPIVLMIENYFSGLIWRLMRECPYIVQGLRRAGFTGGWLSNSSCDETDPLVSIG